MERYYAKIYSEEVEKKMSSFSKEGILRLLRYLKTMDEVVGGYPQSNIFINDGEHLHFPLFCQTLFMGWKGNELTKIIWVKHLIC